MTDTVLVRPRRGLILAGIPREGAEVPRGLAEEWIDDQLVERVLPPALVRKPINTAIRKRRRTR